MLLRQDSWLLGPLPEAARATLGYRRVAMSCEGKRRLRGDRPACRRLCQAHCASPRCTQLPAVCIEYGTGVEWRRLEPSRRFRFAHCETRSVQKGTGHSAACKDAERPMGVDSSELPRSQGGSRGRSAGGRKGGSRGATRQPSGSVRQWLWPVGAVRRVSIQAVSCELSRRAPRTCERRANGGSWQRCRTSAERAAPGRTCAPAALPQKHQSARTRCCR